MTTKDERAQEPDARKLEPETIDDLEIDDREARDLVGGQPGKKLGASHGCHNG